MNKRFLSLLFSVFVAVILLNSCSKEETPKEETQNLVTIKEAEHYFNSNEIKVKKNRYFVGIPEWKNGSFKNDTLVVPLVLKNPLLVKNVDNKKASGYLFPFLMVTKNKENTILDYNLKVLFSSDGEGRKADWYHLYNFENELISENGKKPVQKGVKNSETSRMRCVHWGLFYVDPEKGQDRLISDWWECTGSDNDKEQAPPDGGGGGGSPVETTQAIEDYIDDTELDPCTKDILNKLKNLHDGDIAAMLKRFSTDGSIFTIHMSTGLMDSKSSNIWANTTPTKGSGTDVNMVFNQDYINGKDNPNPPTDLSVATTMAHEIVHAYLISLLEQNKAFGAPGIYDFPTVYEAYVQYQITKDKSILPAAHHELIAEKYVKSIAATIQEFHTGVSVGLGSPKQVYLDLAWGGLKDTNAFSNNYPDNLNHKNYKERERILARIYTEKRGSEYGSNSPIGTPCKK